MSYLAPRILATACLLLAAPLLGSSAEEKPLRTLADEQFEFARQQYAGLVARMDGDKTREPRTIENGKFTAVPPRDWTSGFFPGCLWLIFEHTKDVTLKTAAEEFTGRLESIKDFKEHHDVGFMLYCSYGQGFRLTRNPAYRDVLVQGARSLSTRFDPKVGLIKSWNSNRDWKYPVIIDNMMNLELLMFASEQTGETSFRDIATSHANKTLANHFRPDASSFHLVSYDPETGLPEKKQTVQGYANESAWARGQAWGFYGFTKMYALSKDPAYLAQATKIADFIMKHPRLPMDGIPYWDFDAPRIPDAVRDVSAGAIMCSAFLQLADLTTGEASARYRAMGERQLRTLCTAEFRAGLNENGNFLLMHAVGNMPKKSEVDVPLNYADYYFLEALRLVSR